MADAALTPGTCQVPTGHWPIQFSRARSVPMTRSQPKNEMKFKAEPWHLQGTARSYVFVVTWLLILTHSQLQAKSASGPNTSTHYQGTEFTAGRIGVTGFLEKKVLIFTMFFKMG